MKALNLYTLTRVRENEDFSRLAQALCGRPWQKSFSPHETASLCALVDLLARCFMEDARNDPPEEAAGQMDPRAQSSTEDVRDDPLQEAAGQADPQVQSLMEGSRTVKTGASPQDTAAGQDWISFFDGFWFSYTIEHISKEFDLLKFSADGSCTLNIELKSEAIEEERIRRQLEQNRYYLSHISRTILSYTYVMEEDALYCLNDHGYLKKCPMEELAQAMQRPALQKYMEEDIGLFFRAQDYLISPVKTPEKFLTGRYFLTNQQAEFRRLILEMLTILPESGGKAEADECTPVISLTGNAGTGKTLLLFDLALELSRKRRVLFLHGGPLREGHRIIDSRLHKVKILSGTETDETELLMTLTGKQHDYLLVDEANRFASSVLEALLEQAAALGVPCIFAFDPHSILGPIPAMEDAEAVIARHETVRLELSGNIRINRPIFSFLRELFHRKDRAGHVDYSCIDVLYAGSRREACMLASHYLAKGYEHIDVSPESFRSGKTISQEFDRVLMILDRRFYYDESLHLCADGRKGAAIPPLYEGLSRAREKLCLIIVENRALFSQILEIRTQGQDTR